MAESVLPSTARRSARANRALAHRRRRARQHDLLVAARRCGEDEDLDFREGVRRGQIREMVVDRRAADKIGPLMRWASARVARDPRLRDAGPAEQASHFARLMPDNTIGRHAVQHIEWHLDWQDHRARRRSDDREARGRALEEKVSADLRLIVAAGLHRELNTRLREAEDAAARTPRHLRRAEQLRPVRLFLGLHDVEAFLRDTAGDPRGLWSVVRDVAALAPPGTRAVV